MAKRKRREEQVVQEWVLPQVEIMTNVGLQVTDLHCKLMKHFADWDTFTLFEKYVLGYRDYWYRIDVTPKSPIRHNRDKDYLPGFSPEGNDATYEFSLGLGGTQRGEEQDISIEACNTRIMNSLNGYDPEEQKNRAKARRERKDPWTRRSLVRKPFNQYEEEFGIFTSIAPFHGDELSGWNGLSFEIGNDDENGLELCICIMGLHVYFHSNTLYKILFKPFIKNRPKWERGIQWNEYNKIYDKWAKENRIAYFFDKDWRYEFGVSRAQGFFSRFEFDGGMKSSWTKRFNPWRNKFWNLI